MADLAALVLEVLFRASKGEFADNVLGTLTAGRLA